MAYEFRLIHDGARDGATNMARDEAISRAVSAGQQPPTLRLYGWQPPAISLGQSQRIDSVDEARCRADGVEIVRRPTGGLAILHTDELTYSVSLPIGHPIAEGDVMTSYRRIAEAIMAALRALGVPDVGANRVAKEQRAKGPVCFEAPSDYEVVGAGRKLVGSAQWRRTDGVLQHGSLPLYGDIARICAYLRDAPTPERVRAHAATLEDVLARRVSWDEAAHAWQQAFSAVLDIRFIPGALSPDELRCAEELRAAKYANDEWTRRR
ncbi:MAG: lipoate--protein ligase family protein [Thermoflexales bacterium]|nr:lipoate--protein ligase family protein [Thermoflexales bacterium]MDW8351779.1 biotin/lipoate A/B protein ligase family protein [Anaerolineae bacterium]